MRGVAAGLGAHAGTLIRIEAEITSEVPSGVGDVLGKLGDEVQGVEDLEVACHVAEECLNENWFLSMDDARETVESWRRHYNGERPHSALGYLAPKEFAARSSQNQRTG